MASGILLKKMPPCTISNWQPLNRNRSNNRSGDKSKEVVAALNGKPFRRLDAIGVQARGAFGEFARLGFRLCLHGVKGDLLRLILLVGFGVVQPFLR